MRIDAYNQVAQIYQTTSAKATTATAKTTAKARDEVQISSFAKDLQVAKAAVADSSDIRTDLVADVKERIKNGTYEVSADALADKLMSQFTTIL